MEKDDGNGAVQLFRVVRIPFRVACVSGNLKMRLRVNQDWRTRKVRIPSHSHLQLAGIWMRMRPWRPGDARTSLERVSLRPRP